KEEILRWDVPQSSRIDLLADMINERFTITKSSEDKREYRGLLLANGLRVLLVSDKSTDKSGAAIAVGIGHLCDPWQLPGIAHFCEHMLFLGTQKYPNENEYNKFISENGGMTNASTFPDHTRYYFDIAPTHLKKALDILVQFFLSPQFTESATEREVNAVDSENKNNYKVDSRRVYQLEKSLSRRGHDYRKFGTGNKMTLYEEPKMKGIDTREALLHFHKTFYSANVMTVCIIGRESLDDLEVYINQLGFPGIENKGVIRPSWNEHPLGTEELKQRIEVVPVQDIRKLLLRFPIPDDRKHYRSQATNFIAHLIGHEGIGSLHAALKKRAWVTRLSCGSDYPANGFGSFQIEIDISEEGFAHVDDIIILLFNYIGMLKRSGSLRRWWDEMAQIYKLLFTYKDKEQPIYYAPYLSQRMLEYPMEDVLYAHRRCDLYDEGLIAKVLNQLRPDNFIYFVISKQFDGNGFDREKWYETEYKRYHFTKEFIASCERAMTERNEDLALPPPNEYIPTDFTLKIPEPRVNYPHLSHNDEWSRLWHFTDISYGLPKCTIYLWISSPVSYRTAADFAYMDLMVECFKDAMSATVYDAALINLNYQLQPKAHGLELKLEGFNEKVPLFLNILLTSLVQFQPKENIFKGQQEQYARRLRNFFLEQPFRQAVFYLKLVLAEKKWSNEELLVAANDASLVGLNEYIAIFFESFHIEALVHGNIDEQTSGSLIKSIVEKIRMERAGCKPIEKKESLQFKEHLLPTDSTTLYRRTQKTHINSTLLTFLQVGQRSNRGGALLSLLSQIFQEPSFDILRTKEQLGYIVFCSCRRECGNHGLRLIVQGLKDPKFVIWRVENFIYHMKEVMEKMSDEELRSHMESVATKRLEKPKKLKLLTDKYWKEVTDRSYQFNRDEVEVGIMRKLSKNELIDFYNQCICHNATGRKVLHVIVRSELCDGPPECDIDAEMKKFCTTVGTTMRELRGINCVHNLSEFKMRLPLYDLDKSDIEAQLIAVK
uniref:Insulin-degrading enzyme n=1 Tax=Parascaris univalens TaxID=6257 RepID=A0A915BTP0_PARUN